MIERHRNAEPIVRRKPHRFADEEAVVEDIVVRQRRALGEARRTGRKLDVDRLVELQKRAKLGDTLRFRTSAAGEDLGETECAGMPSLDQHHRTQRRQPLRFEFSRSCLSHLRRQLAQYAHIVRGLEFLGENQRLAADLVERIFELGGAIGRIDIDQDETGLRRSKLRQHPFAVVGRPDTDAIAGLEAERQKSGGELVDGLLQFAIRHAHFLVPHDKCRMRRPFRANCVEEPPDRLADQRNLACAIDVALRERRHRVFLRIII